MPCKCLDEGKECGEPELIPGVCYDHCVRCTVCHENPANPLIRVCEDCIKRILILSHPKSATIDNTKNPNIMPPSNLITANMIRFARVDDDWHFASNLNALMQKGYCSKCGLTPEGCKREGCLT